MRKAPNKRVEVLNALVDQQLSAVAFNEAVLGIKVKALKAVIILSAVATILLGVEIGQGRGS